MLLSSPRLKVPLERLSATSMSLFVSCPEAFRQKYLLGKRETLFGSGFVGSINHETVAEVLRNKMAGAEALDVDVNRLYRDFWASKLDEEGEPDWKDDDPAEMYVRGLNMASLYVEKVVPSINPVAVEQRVELELPGLPMIVGYVDVLEKDKVRERKTTSVKTTKPKSRWRFQGKLYHLMTELPVEWDVITRQKEPRLYMADEHPELRLASADNDVTVRMIRNIAQRMSDLYERKGSEMVWPLEGFFGDWTCEYCAIGPKHASTCGVWQ